MLDRAASAAAGRGDEHERVDEHLAERPGALGQRQLAERDVELTLGDQREQLIGVVRLAQRDLAPGAARRGSA